MLRECAESDSGKNQNIALSDFRFNTLIPSLNQGQGSAFKVWECAQSIPRLEKSKNRRFSHKNPKIFDFRFNTPIPSLNRVKEAFLRFGSARNRFSA